jgi:hypothetical protein
MSERRRRPIGLTTKLTAEEFATLKTQAGARTVSEWARETLLAAARPRPADCALMAEVLALRVLVLNLSRAAHPERLTDKYMLQVIANADEDKDQRARDRLTAAVVPSVPAPSVPVVR